MFSSLSTRLILEGPWSNVCLKGFCEFIKYFLAFTIKTKVVLGSAAFPFISLRLYCSWQNGRMFWSFEIQLKYWDLVVWLLSVEIRISFCYRYFYLFCIKILNILINLNIVLDLLNVFFGICWTGHLVPVSFPVHRPRLFQLRIFYHCWPDTLH